MPHGKRLVLATEQDAGVDILHACGGNARCTTCRVEFLAGEPDRMTEAEKNKLAERGLTGVRLSCQIEVDHDMSIRAISRLEGSGRVERGDHRRMKSHRPRSGLRVDGCTNAPEQFPACGGGITVACTSSVIIRFL